MRIDGAHGGQAVRTSVALSCITKKPVAIENIRRERGVPGLRAQHVAAVRILQKICGARVEGAALGSTELRFIPGDVRGCRLEEDVGTAGSICLILQAVIPAVAASEKDVELKVVGGTDVAWSPTFDYMRHVVREAYGRMGLGFSISLERRGYYPKGGGRVVLRARSREIMPARLLERRAGRVEVRCTYSKIPEEAVVAEVERIVGGLEERHCVVGQHVREEDALDAGAAVLAHVHDEGSVLGADALFDRRAGAFDMKPDRIAENRLGVDENLADMLVVPASVAPGLSVFRVPRITRHLEANLRVASKVSGCRYGVGRVEGGYEVRIRGASYPGVH